MGLPKYSFSRLWFEQTCSSSHIHWRTSMFLDIWSQ